MLKPLKKCFKKYATTVTVNLGNETYTGKAFISPLRYENRVYIDNIYKKGGAVDGGRYLYIGQPQLRLDTFGDGVRVVAFEKEFTVKKAEPYIVNGDVKYIWAVLVAADRSDDIGDVYG